jgi:peptide/nickel transport system substrate-binding protein
MRTYFRVRPHALKLSTALLVGALLLVPAARAQTSDQQAARQPAGYAVHRAATAIDDGTVTLVTNGSAADLDPATDELASSDMIQRNIDQTLISFDGPSITKYRPVLSTGWDVKNGGKTYVFHLRHGVFFHTGREMTAADVQYCLVRTISAGLVNNYLLSRFISKPAKQITVVDKYTVRFDLNSPQQFFLPSLANEYVTSILDSHALKAHVKKHDWGHDWASTHDAGTGPYMLKSWQHSQQVVLVRFPRYWGGWSGHHFSKVIVSTVPESSTRRELVEKGQADLTFQLTPQDYQAMSKNSRLRIVAPYGAEVDYITMTQAGHLKSPYARQAMSYAFNYDAVINSALHGYGRRAYGPIPAVLLGYDPSMFHYRTDLNKAKALFQKAGIKSGTTFTYTYNTSPENDAAGRILQAQLGQIGMNLKLQQVDEATLNSIFYGSEPASKRPDLMPFGWWPDYNDPYDMANILVGSWNAAPTGANAGIYHDGQVDTTLNQMKSAGGARLLQLAKRLQDLTGRVDPPAIWMAEPAQATVMQRNLRGFVFNPLGLQTYNFFQLHR